MKKHFKTLAMMMVCMAMALCVSCKKNDDSSDSGGGNTGGGSTLTEEGIYLGVMGFNDDLYTKDISLLNNSTKYEFKTFISDLTTANGTGLYYADYVALENLKSSQEPPKLTNVVLVTFTDGLDNVSIGPSLPNPGNYNTDEEYRNALHDKIKNDIVHGKHINAYTIGLKGLDAQADIETFRANLKKLASDDNNVYEAENMNEALESFAEIAESLHSVSTNSKLMLKVPGGYNNGSLIRFTFDDITAAENSNLYVEGTYSKNSSGLLIENITYHGFKDGATSLTSVGVEGSYYQIVFENLTKTNGELLTQTDINRIKLWQKKSDNWVPETEFTPSGSTQVIEEQSSALIMLVLDCTTSLGNDFNNMKTAAQQFVETLSSNGGGGNATTAPTVTTSSVSDVTTSSAKCGGDVASDGGAAVTARGVCWSTSQNPTVSDSHTTDGSGIGSFTSNITGLTSDTTYYVRAYATNRKGTTYGEQRSFTTQSGGGGGTQTAPTVTTAQVSNITETTATCGGDVASDGGAAVTARGVCWSTSQNPTVSDSHTIDGSGIGSFTSDITGLTAGTTYYVRAYATNSAGTSYGEQRSFTTQSGGGGGTTVDKTFSVSPSESVCFSPGNLQYKASTKQWRFAEKQWDYIGEANENISSTYSGWIDLFGWGTGDNPTQYSTHNSDYPSFKDWGDYCGLPTPEGTTGKWRTLTKDEWNYVMFGRTTSSGVRYAKAKVNGVDGIIVVPDSWSKDIYSLNSTNSTGADFSANVISATAWESICEPAGCVFLPASGCRFGTAVYEVGSDGYYWSGTPSGTDYAYYLRFYSGFFDPQCYERRYGGFSVRLVCPAQK